MSDLDFFDTSEIEGFLVPVKLEEIPGMDWTQLETLWSELNMIKKSMEHDPE